MSSIKPFNSVGPDLARKMHVVKECRCLLERYHLYTGQKLHRQWDVKLNKFLYYLNKFLDLISPKEIYPPRLTSKEYEEIKKKHSKEVAGLLGKYNR